MGPGRRIQKVGGGDKERGEGKADAAHMDVD